MGTRQDNAVINASITDKLGLLSLGRMDGRSGGVSDSASTTHARAGIGGRQAHGGRQEVSPVIVKRPFDADMQAIISRLRAAAGKAKMQVTEQPENDEGVPEGSTETWTGILKSVHVGDRDTETNAIEMIELEMVVDGEVTVN